MADWPAATPIETERLTLEPLRAGHAGEMARALDDPALHRFIGGEPLTPAQLKARYARLAAGASADGRQGWLNWIVRRRSDATPVGTVQSTLRRSPAGLQAQVAWVIRSDQQRLGYAGEAAAGMVAWLVARGVTGIEAHIHPGNVASEGVAAGLAMDATERTVDGEAVWVLAAGS
jgi:RimJ/RimL family protein N-acetyltransferase